MRIFLIVNILTACLSLCMLHSAMAFETPGVSVTILAEPGINGDLVYPIGESPVPLRVFLTFDSNKSVVTEGDFSEIELHHSLTVVDPNNVKHVLRPFDDLHKMEQPYFLEETAWSPAESIPPGWVKITTIEDLRNLVPKMYSLPGWYTIVAEQPFVRFARIKDYGEVFGKIGEQGNEENWSGVLVSNTLEVHIKPPGSATIKVTILDNSFIPPGKLFYVPVRVFSAADVLNESDPQVIWNTKAYIIEKLTETDGTVLLDTDGGCLSQDDYKIIAKYSDEYQMNDVLFTDTNWADSGCAPTIIQEMGFGEPAPPEAEPGDLDVDGDVDRDDMTIILSHRNQPATECPPCDLDGDGTITVLDARKLVLLCTRPRCATQ